MDELSKSECPEDLQKFIDMRMNSAFFTSEYKRELMALITAAILTEDWHPVRKFMWPEFGGKN